MPDGHQWPKPALNRRFTARLIAFGPVRSLPATGLFPERAAWLWGLTATAGYRVSRFHAVTCGLEVVDDGYIREQARRGNGMVSKHQVSLLGGYELWLGRYVFTTHLGWTVRQSAVRMDERIFQCYQLLYTLRDRYLLGIGLKARLNVAEGFEVRMGLRF